MLLSEPEHARVDLRRGIARPEELAIVVEPARAERVRRRLEGASEAARAINTTGTEGPKVADLVIQIGPEVIVCYYDRSVVDVIVERFANPSSPWPQIIEVEIVLITRSARTH